MIIKNNFSHSLFSFFFLAVLVVFPLVSVAQGLTNIKGLAEDALDVIAITIAIVFFLAILVFSWGVVKYISAAGDATKVKDARRILWWGILGIFVLAAMFSIVKFIGSALGITDTAGGGILRPPTVRIPEGLR